MDQNEGFSRDVVMDLQNASSSKCRLAAGTQTVLQARWAGQANCCNICWDSVGKDWHREPGSSEILAQSDTWFFTALLHGQGEPVPTIWDSESALNQAKAKLAAGFDARGLNPGSRRVGECQPGNPANREGLPQGGETNHLPWGLLGLHWEWGCQDQLPSVSSEPILATPSRRERQFEHEQKESGASNFWPSFQLGLKSGCDFQAFGCPARCGFVAFVCVVRYLKDQVTWRWDNQKEVGRHNYENNKDSFFSSSPFHKICMPSQLQHKNSQQNKQSDQSS